MLQSSSSAPEARDDALCALDLAFYPKQYQALWSTATELFFGGASEGGKSWFVRAALILWCTWINNLQCIIFRKYYRDVIDNHMNGPQGFRSMLRPWVEKGWVKITENEVRFWNGSLIQLAQLRTNEDAEKNQGREKHVQVFEESCQMLWRHMMAVRGWCRMPKEMKEALPPELKNKFPCVLYTGNPIGISAGHFRRKFVKARPEGVVEQTDDKEGGFLRQYIKSLVTDNPSADPVAQRSRLSGMTDAATAEALITANWDAPVGDYFRSWNDDIHMVPDFQPPSHWWKFRTFDWGSAEPFAVYWWAVSDGEEFEAVIKAPDGSGRLVEKKATLWFPRGALIAYREWYGCDPEAPEKGLGLRNEEVADGIVERTKETTSGLTFTDSFPFADKGFSDKKDKYTIADVFRDHGVPLTKGNTARIFGWGQLDSRLKGIETGNGTFIPLIYFCACCKAAQDYIPAIARDDEDPEDCVDSGEATHSPDAIRLACTVRPRVTTKAKDRGAPLPRNNKARTVNVADLLKQTRKNGKR